MNTLFWSEWLCKHSKHCYWLGVREVKKQQNVYYVNGFSFYYYFPVITCGHWVKLWSHKHINHGF